MKWWRFSYTGDYSNMGRLLRRTSGRLTREEARLRYVPLEVLAEEGKELIDTRVGVDETKKGLISDILNPDSIRLLDSWGVKGKIKSEAAIQSPEQLTEIYSRLEGIVEVNTQEFVALVPWPFTNTPKSLESYFSLLSKATRLIYEIFGDEVPQRFDFRKKPSAYKDAESLRLLVDEVRAYQHQAAIEIDTPSQPAKQRKPYEEKPSELEKIKGGLKNAGYDMEMVDWILIKGMSLYSRNPHVGGFSSSFVNIQRRTLGKKPTQTETARFEKTFQKLRANEIFLEEKTSKAYRTPGYSIIGNVESIQDPNLKQYVSLLLRDRFS